MAVHIDPTGHHVTIPGPDGEPLPSQPGTLIRLTSPGGAQATVNAATGFNVVDWRVPVGDQVVPLVYHDEDVLAGGSGTRSGIPVLFPFPNRIAGATYPWQGRSRSLPPAHPGDPNAIHGFCAKRPWADVSAGGESAVTGTFRISRDAADVAADWPGDLEVAITYDLADRALRIESRVTNTGDGPAPFGLGYHPYFTTLGSADLADVLVQVPAAGYWELVDSIPTGVVEPVTGERDLRRPVAVGDRARRRPDRTADIRRRSRRPHGNWPA
ncbi:MAG: aldose 1-epimerase [Candidatus Nanopelagicales bacterium]